MTDKYFDAEPKQNIGYDLNVVGSSEKSLYFGLYVRTSQFERHLVNISNRYKNIAISWLLASYTAIGFLLSVEVKQLPFDPMIAVLLVAFLSAMGNTLLWHLDINVYSKFWAAVFVEQIRLETAHPFLVSNKGLSLSIDAEREKILSHAVLYIVVNGLQVITMGAAFFVLFRSQLIETVLGGLFFLALLLFVLSYMLHASRQIKKVFNAMVQEVA